MVDPPAARRGVADSSGLTIVSSEAARALIVNRAAASGDWITPAGFDPDVRSPASASTFLPTTRGCSARIRRSPCAGGSKRGRFLQYRRRLPRR